MSAGGLGGGWNTGGGGGGGTPIVGSGTPTYLPMFVGASTLGDSVVYQDGTNIGVGLTSTLSKLHVAGAIRTGVASSVNGSFVFQNSTNAFTVTINSAATAASYSWTLPFDQGGVSTVLTNNGAGVLSWTSPSSTAWMLDGNTVGSEKWIGTIDNFDMPFRTNNVQNMVLTATGYLGIRTTSVNTVSPLTVSASGNLNTFTMNHSGNGVGIYTDRTSNAVYSGSQYATGGTTKWIFSPRGDGTENFYMYNYTISQPVMLFSATSGFLSVGYGVSTPSAALHVYASSNTSATYALRVDSSTVNNIFTVRDDGYISAGLTNGGMTIGFGSGFDSSVTNNTFLGVGIATVAYTGVANTAIGSSSLAVLTSGTENTSVGYFTLKALTTGNNNVAINSNALLVCTTGSNNVAIGANAMKADVTPTQNIAIGHNALLSANGSYFNVGIGQDALRSIIGKGKNTAVGYAAGYNNNGDGNCFYGNYAGYYETSSNSYYLNNQDRANTAGDKSLSLVYGIFDAAVANQLFTVNGTLVSSFGSKFKLDAALGSDGTYNGTTIDGTAGATLAFGDLIYLDPTDSRWELVDANAASGADGDARGTIGICVLAAAADGSATTILLQGTVRADAAFPAMTINAPMYASETAGDITGTPPATGGAVVRTIGFAITADEIYFNPSSDFTTV